ncbi:hypothetical protein HK414_24310 [Ramlibacter terrae]|uniref:DUF2304 domain-containing protein n=1 Tax=Ramlibacter terrae TaxID=2732511 RepID=A0ABX6P6M4_9BURK|nr:hypothetical protein HK414_24310 [Ramlibacter terrae]
MQWWLSSAGALIAALVTFVISWSALKPRQRLFATRLVSRWAQRAAIAFATLYFTWVNVDFLMKDGPIARLELFVLLLANAEALILILVHLFVKAFSGFLDKRNERWEKMSARIATLEARSPSGPSSQGTRNTTGTRTR